MFIHAVAAGNDRWFFVLASINVFNWLFATPLWSIVWPKAIADQFGDAEKTQVLGLLRSVTVAVQLFSPLAGDLSDNLPLVGLLRL